MIGSQTGILKNSKVYEWFLAYDSSKYSGQPISLFHSLVYASTLFLMHPSKEKILGIFRNPRKMNFIYGSEYANDVAFFEVNFFILYYMHQYYYNKNYSKWPALSSIYRSYFFDFYSNHIFGEGEKIKNIVKNRNILYREEVPLTNDDVMDPNKHDLLTKLVFNSINKVKPDVVKNYLELDSIFINEKIPDLLFIKTISLANKVEICKLTTEITDSYLQ